MSGQSKHEDDGAVNRVNNRRFIGTYSSLIGTFIIRWSKLEHELNVAISKVINNGDQKIGYLIIENLTAFDKIVLFHRLYLELENANSKSNAIKLLSLKYKLTELNSFKNSIVHANWQTMSKKGFVRTKTRRQDDEGSIEVRNVLIKPVTLRTQIKNAIGVTSTLMEIASRATADSD